jgi:hypothetical protein
VVEEDGEQEKEEEEENEKEEEEKEKVWVEIGVEGEQEERACPLRIKEQLQAGVLGRVGVVSGVHQMSNEEECLAALCDRASRDSPHPDQVMSCAFW